VRSLARTLLAWLQDDFDLAARAAGSRIKPASALRQLPERGASEAFDTVEFDAHKVDLQMRSGHIVVMLCDEAQRLSKHALKWLRDVHDQLAHHGLRLITFLVGEPRTTLTFVKGNEVWSRRSSEDV